MQSPSCADTPATLLSTSWLFRNANVAPSPAATIGEHERDAAQAVLEVQDMLSTPVSRPSSGLEQSLSRVLDGSSDESSWYLDKEQLFYQLQIRRHDRLVNGGSAKKDPPSTRARTRLEIQMGQVDQLCTKWQALDSLVPGPCVPEINAGGSRTYAWSSLVVSIHHPSNPSKRLVELGVSSHHTLRHLRDHLFCDLDYTNENRDLNNPQLGCPKRSPSVFVIENVVYIDSRACYEDVGISEIHAWCQFHGGPQLVCSMDVELGSIAFRVATPYVFLHHDGCEHMVVVQDMINTHSLQSGDPNAPPAVLFQCVRDELQCAVCKARIALYVTLGDRYGPENPCRWCQECFSAFHYGQEGDPVLLYDDFTVFTTVKHEEQEM